MDDRTQAEEFGTERAFSKLDWPTPEMLVSAHRARARVLREMTVALGRKLGMLIQKRLFKSRLSHGGSDSAEETAHMTIASVAMFRNQMRRDIRTMQAGHDPAGLCRDAGVTPTYCSDTVVRLSLETNSATDRKLMSKTGRQLADGPADVERARRAVSGPRQRRLGVTRPRTADCHSPSHPARTLAPKDCDMEDLIMAALSGDDVRVSQLLDAGVDVNHADENGWTVLTSAARRGHGDIVERVLVAGANVDRADIKGLTALMKAAEGGHVAIAERLLEAKASIDHTDANGRTALMRAVENRRVEMVNLLVKSGANVNRADRRGKTALMRAVLGGDKTIIDQLLEAGANVHPADANGWTALICAAAGDVSIVKELIKANPDINHAAKDGMTALKRASASGHTAIVELLEADIRLRAELG